MTSYVVVIPTLGRPCLQHALDTLAAADGPLLPRQVVLADDRRDTPEPLPVTIPAALAGRTVVVTLEGRGPAAARNAGWRAAEAADWVAFLDDDVRVGPRWRAELVADLAAQPADVAGVQGVIDVPLPPDRRPTDWERGTAGLASARWITADLAYRRNALLAAGGFDERFPRAFREDADLALRLLDLGWALRQGARRTTHPVRPGLTLGQPRGPGRQRRRRAHEPAARPRLAPAGRGRPGTLARACGRHDPAGLGRTGRGGQRPAGRPATGQVPPGGRAGRSGLAGQLGRVHRGPGPPRTADPGRDRARWR